MCYSSIYANEHEYASQTKPVQSVATTYVATKHPVWKSAQPTNLAIENLKDEVLDISKGDALDGIAQQALAQENARQDLNATLSQRMVSISRYPNRGHL